MLGVLANGGIVLRRTAILSPRAKQPEIDKTKLYINSIIITARWKRNPRWTDGSFEI
jgi:hypothetical protein